MNICSICKQKDLDFTKIKSKKIKKFINNNNINDTDNFSIMLKKCKCSNKSHKLCILLNIILNYEIKCETCNSFYNIDIIKKNNIYEKIKIIILMIILIIIHLAIYCFCIVLILFNFIKDAWYNIKNINKDKYFHIQYFFFIIIFILNSYFVSISIRYIINKFKYSYKYLIYINDFNSDNKIDDNKYFELLYEIYKKFHNDSLSNLVYKKNKIFFFNKINNNIDI